MNDARVATSIADPKPAALQAVCDRIGKTINSIYEAQARIDTGLNRLVNPAPREVGADGAAEEQPKCLEARLHSYLRQIEHAAKLLHTSADRFDASV